MITPDELAHLKAIAFGSLESEFDKTFWSDGGTTVQSLITQIELLQKELRDCRRLLADVIATAPHNAPNRPSIKAAADWLANWNGERLDCGSDDKDDVVGGSMRMTPTDEGAFQRPYPFTIDNRTSPLEPLDAHEAGRLAFGQGKGFLDNPYPDGSTEFRRYVDGLVHAIKASNVALVREDHGSGQ